MSASILAITTVTQAGGLVSFFLKPLVDGNLYPKIFGNPKPNMSSPYKSGQIRKRAQYQVGIIQPSEYVDVTIQAALCYPRENISYSFARL